MHPHQSTAQHDHDREKEALVRQVHSVGQHLSQGELLDLADAIHEIVRRRRGHAPLLAEKPTFSSRDEG